MFFSLIYSPYSSGLIPAPNLTLSETGGDVLSLVHSVLYLSEEVDVTIPGYVLQKKLKLFYGAFKYANLKIKIVITVRQFGKS